MTKAQAIGQIRTRGERDPKISDGALRLLLRICSHIYTNPRATLDKPFPLPWSMVAVWCFLKDDKSASRRIAELVDEGYLKCDGLRGCPPINHFFLIPNCPARGAIKHPARGAINSGSRGADHISNSLQEEKIKVKREDIGSLRSKGTKGDLMAAPPAAQKVTMTAAERLGHWQAAKQAEGFMKKSKDAF
jgi:hypothetical protein